MNPESYNENLWEDIPTHAFMALGRRGKESIDLHQCFIPSCTSTGNEHLHPISKQEEVLPIDLENVQKKRTSFTIFCESCNHNFSLLFERSIYIDSDKNSDEINTQNIIVEVVSARNPETEENYGEIGYVQYATKRKR